MNKTCPTCGKQLSRGARAYCGKHAPRSSQPLADRLWAKVMKTSDADDECWPWTGARIKKGYGNVFLGTVNGKKKFGTSSRVVWEVTFGPIPDGFDVCHSCDNPPCCRPKHLFLGTRAENLADMIRKKRDVDRWNAKLTPENVLAIRSALSSETQSSIARRFGVSYGIVHRLAQGSYKRVA